jgi:hypothetical protein
LRSGARLNKSNDIFKTLNILSTVEFELALFIDQDQDSTKVSMF